MDRIFCCFTRADVRQPSGRRDLNAGEIAPAGVTTLLSFLQLKVEDIFGDIGSGTGSVLAQAAMQAPAQRCIGLEFRSELAARSRPVIQEWSLTFPSLSRVTILAGDIRDDMPSTSLLKECTVVLCNNMLFEHRSNTSVVRNSKNEYRDPTKPLLTAWCCSSNDGC
jgi:predicted RNA methylase